MACFLKAIKEEVTMAEKEVEVKENEVGVELVANPKCFTTIPNSNSEFCIYTYKAEFEPYNQVMRKGFFNPAHTFLNVGDTVRVFRFNTDRVLVNYIMFIVTNVDKINKSVDAVPVYQSNVIKK